MDNKPKKLLLVINPNAGTHQKDEVAQVATEVLTPCGFEITADWTTGPGDATRMAQNAVADGFYGVIVAGGDGTINEVARGLRGSDVAMGILPCGSGNGLARHLGIKMDVEGGLDVIKENNIISVDYGTVNDKPFFCTFGVGFDAAVSERFARQERRGRMSYIKSAVLEFLNFAPEVYTISLPDGTVLTEKAFLVAVCNASQYGNNAYIAPNASITDGLFDVTIIHSGSPLTTALVGLDLITGSIDHNMLIDRFKAKALTIKRAMPGPMHIDGEPMVSPCEMSIRCHHHELRIFSPTKEKQFKMILTPMQSF
ncbi:MAG: diacylglycerol kinase family lipid kinase, partial [Paramuribaculum sp.]|nr:diacylglycerol kinase family lipid kinase [Paramuribaculum sp.]